jgi:mRNA-degrading endonuclease toxin of MazEF toxin-antitoxin module
MDRILRGEIRWANLDPVQGSEQAGRRPVLILSRDLFNERSGTVIAVALTSEELKVGFHAAAATDDDAYTTMLRKAGVTQTTAANRPIVVENKFESIMALLDRIGC